LFEDHTPVVVDTILYLIESWGIHSMTKLEA